MPIIAERAAIKATETASGGILVKALVAGQWTTIFCADLSDRSIDAYIEDLRDVLAEVEDRVHALRTAREAREAEEAEREDHWRRQDHRMAAGYR